MKRCVIIIKRKLNKLNKQFCFQLQRSTISQRQRPIEAPLRNRLLVWRFLKKIENEPVPTIIPEQDFLITNNHNNNNLDNDNNNNNNPWMLDLHANYDDENGIDMDIESDLVNIVGNNTSNDINNNNNNLTTYETMNIDQTSDVNLLLKRAIGAERRQKTSTDNFYFNDSNYTNNTNCHQISETNTYDETEQFFHDLCAELTNTTATLVSSSTSNIFNFSSTPEQTLIH
jgi:hypothetical protein